MNKFLKIYLYYILMHLVLNVITIYTTILVLFVITVYTIVPQCSISS